MRNSYNLIVTSLLVLFVLVLPAFSISADNGSDTCTGRPGPYGVIIDGDCPDTFLVDNEVIAASALIFTTGVSLLAGAAIVKPETLERFF